MSKLLKKIVIPVIISCLISSCGMNKKVSKSPAIMLWAWERNEDLRFLNSDEIGVAYLAQTLNITDKKVVLIPRRQPLKINPDTFLIAVTRIETNRPPMKFSDSQLEETAELIINSSLRKNVSGIQIDFDAKVSEREFYKQLLQSIRGKLPPNKMLSITALASFCIGDRWMKDLPIDEAVPMIFDMGIDRRQIDSYLNSGRDFTEPLCRTSYGFAIYEPKNITLEQNRTRYYFNSKPWKPSDTEKLK